MKFVLLVALLVAAAASPLNDDSRLRGDTSVSYTRVNVTTSPFVTVTNVRNATIYSTPAQVLIGNARGEITRCKVEDLHVCEVLYEVGAEVWGLVVTGEFVYACTREGNIFRCNLNEKDSCKIFYTKSSDLYYALATARGFLFVVAYSTILRFKLNEPNSCQTFHETGSTVFDLTVFNDKIYTGSTDGLMKSCSLKTENNCTFQYNTNHSFQGLTSANNSIFALTSNNYLWKCTQESEAESISCSSLYLPLTAPINIASFNGVLYTLDDFHGICKLEDILDDNCFMNSNMKEKLIMAFTYGTYEMQSRFKGEDTTCQWQSEDECPPGVSYYNAYDRAQLEVHVKDNKLYDAFGKLVDTSNVTGRSGPAALFAMGPDGTILLSKQNKRGVMHTSSFFAGSPVSGAGEMVVENGVIKKMSACSDHYQPDLVLNGQVLQSLRAQGYTDPIVSELCPYQERG